MTHWDNALNVMGNLPPEQRADFMVTGVNDLPTNARRYIAATILDGLSPSDRRAVVSGTVLGAPQDAKGLMRIWIWVLAILGSAILLFGGASLWLLLAEKPAEGMIALVSLALGAVAGLLAPSPTTTNQST